MLQADDTESERWQIMKMG